MAFLIDDMKAEDWPEVATIYAEGLETRLATFETQIPSWKRWDTQHFPKPRLVVRDGEQVLAWAALSPVSKREVYRGVAEVSIYVAAQARGRGIGKKLLLALIEGSESEGFWTLQASLFPQNESSVRLHLACGFRQVGRRERISQLDGIWRDTIIMERRSKTVGIS